ncbi:MAG: hypothetical protein ACJ79V_02560 [Myxococcales bacterium]
MGDFLFRRLRPGFAILEQSVDLQAVDGVVRELRSRRRVVPVHVLRRHGELRARMPEGLLRVGGEELHVDDQVAVGAVLADDHVSTRLADEEDRVGMKPLQGFGEPLVRIEVHVIDVHHLALYAAASEALADSLIEALVYVLVEPRVLDARHDEDASQGRRSLQIRFRVERRLSRGAAEGQDSNPGAQPDADTHVVPPKLVATRN